MILAMTQRSGRHLAADDRGPQSPGRFDRDDRLVAGERAAREHHAGRAGIDHALHDDRHRNARFREFAPAAVAHRFDRVEARPAAADACAMSRAGS